MRKFKVAWSVGLGVFLPISAGAVGYRMPNQDAEAIARGNAFVATADNPSAIYYNPAGITQLEGHHVSVGAYFITTGIDFTAPDGRSASPDSDFQTVPQIHYVYSPSDSKWSFGVGLFAPFGLGVDWGSDTPFSTEAEEALMVYATLNPVVAYQVNDSLSLAAGLTVNYSEVEFQQAAILPAMGGGFELGQFRYEGDDLSIGFNLGILYQPHEQWSFGLNYRSSGEMNYVGRSRLGAPTGEYQPTDIGVNFPDNIDLGVSYRPDENWNIEFNIDWTNWDKVDVSTFEGTAFGDISLPFNYRSGFVYELGVTRQLGKGYWVSAGYAYSENSVPDQTLTPLNADDDLHIGSIGFGHRSPDWGWSIAYHFAYNGNGRDVTGNTPSAAGETSDGNYEVFNQAVNVSCQFSF
jgi:long-chain fatty acid transport protein